MSTINIFQISFEIWGCIISIIVCILLGTASFSKKDAVGNKIRRMILINNFILVSDALAYIYRGDLTPMGCAFTRISNFVMFALQYILLALISDYAKHIIAKNKSKSTWWDYLAFSLLFIAFIGLVITQLTGWYYSFDDTNHYQRENGIWISFAICGLVLLLCCVRLCLNRKNLSQSEKSTFMMCVVISLICIVVQFVFYGLSLINTGITISLLLMYFRHIKSRYDTYMDNCIEEAIRDTKALCERSVSLCTKQAGEVQYEENKE